MNNLFLRPTASITFPIPNEYINKLLEEVEKIVEKKVEVPVIQEKIITVTEVVEKIVPQLSEQVKVV